MRFLSQLYENLGLSSENGLVNFKDVAGRESSLQGKYAISLKIIEQLNILKPDAFYHFNGIPLILFFENPSPADTKRIHRQSWCFNQSPVIFILTEEHLSVFNAFHYDKKYDLEPLPLDESEIKQHFSFWELQSGNTWKWIERTFFKGKSKQYRVDRYLLDNIGTAISLLDKRDLPIKLANRIILRLIFIRYLIDRGVIIDESYISGLPEEDELRKENFNRLIMDRERLYCFFAYLKERFNGNLFEIHEDEDQVKQEHLDLLSNLFKGTNLATGEQTLFDVYDFSIIPIELISGIYESVIDKKKRKKNAAIYTPTFLVDYILENTVSHYLQNAPAAQCKILDPSCGSGIFLVEAYRRLVEKEITNETISDQKLIELLEKNIYGIDLDEVALNVAIFSLYVAVLDYKDPKTLQNLKLPTLLNQNLFHANFLDINHTFNTVLKQADLKFIIGNPPWKHDNSQIHLSYIKKYSFTDRQIARTFLIRTRDFSTTHTECALIVTSSILHKVGTIKHFLTNFFVDKVLDLSAVRRLIFKDAQNPASIIFYRYAFQMNTKKSMVRYISLMPNIFLTHFNTLVIEKNDIKKISQGYFLKYPWMWKVALYGSSMDVHLLERLNKHPSKIKNIINKKGGVFVGNGIVKGTQKKNFSYLTNLPIIDPADIKGYYTVINETTRRFKPEDTLMASCGKPELFEGEHIFFKRRMANETRLTVSYTEISCAFWNSAYSITSETNPEKLKELYALFISDLFTYFQYMTSANWGIFFPEVNLKEYLAFPYRQVGNVKKIIDLVNRFIQYYKNHYEKALRPQNIPLPVEFEQINRLVYDTYEIDEIEKDLINYVLDVSRYLFKSGSTLEKVFRPLTDDDLLKYAHVFYDHFGKIYNSPGEYFQVEYFLLGYFAAMKFKIVPVKPPKGSEIIKSKEKDPDAVILKVLAQTGSLYRITSELYQNKVINGFEKDFFYIIKPNEFKSWHRAIAHLDLLEFTAAINHAELQELKKNE